MKKMIFASVLLIGLGIFMGVLLVSNLNSNWISNLFADSKVKIGADNAPVQLNDAVKTLNEAMVSAANSILPTVVYISVESESKANPNREMEENDFFRFFAPHGGDMPMRGSGSGVIITSDGYIVTNNHVVENAKDGGIKVTTMDKKEYSATLVGTDPFTDLAVIKIDATGLAVAHLGDISTVRVGEMVFAVGNPLGLNSTVTSGIVSAVGRGALPGNRRGGYNVEHYIQTDAAINPGNSGGGLYDLRGSLIGINTAIATETGSYIGYGFAIPVDLMRSVVDDLIDDGEINRGYIGVVIKPIDELMAKGLGLNKVEGVLIDDIQKGKAGDKAGLESKDVILEVNGKPVNSPSELQSTIVFYRAGDKVKLTIFRDGKKIYKDVVLQPSDDKEVAVKGNDKKEKEESKDSKEPVKFDKLGFTAENLTSKIKDEYGIDNGVLVSGIKRFSPASDRGLFNGAVITKIDKEEIKSPGQLKKIIDTKKKGDVILLHVKYQDRSQIVAIEIND